jgi:hypothetical protein
LGGPRGGQDQGRIKRTRCGLSRRNKSLFLLQVGLKAGLNASLDLDGTASGLFSVASNHVRRVLDELSAILKECGDGLGSRGKRWLAPLARSCAAGRDLASAEGA